MPCGFKNEIMDEIFWEITIKLMDIKNIAEKTGISGKIELPIRQHYKLVDEAVAEIFEYEKSGRHIQVSEKLTVTITSD